MSRFLDSVSTIISVFHNQAKEDGDGSTLSRRKMKEFIEREFADVIDKPHDPQTIDKILQFLEWDCDGEIDFNEFLLLAFRVAKACYWYLPREPYLLQKTKLTTSSKSLQEHEIPNRGSRRQLQEEEQRTCDRNRRRPQCEAELRQDSRARELREQAEERQHLERPRPEQVADVRRRSQSCEPQALPNQRGGRQPREPARPEHDHKTQRPQEADRGSHNQPRKPELLIEEKSRDHLQEREQKATERNSRRPREAEGQGSRRPHQSYLQEPLEIDLRCYDACEPERGHYEKRNRQEREIQHLESEREINEDRDWVEIDDTRRKDPVRERRIDRQRELDLQVYEQRRRQTQEREERGAITSQRDTRDREGDRRRQRETVRYERTRDAEVAAAEADVKIHRVSRELEPQQGVRRDCLREREEPEDERRTCWDQDTEEPVRVRRIDHQQELDLQVYERRRRQTQEREERGAITSQRDTREREGDRRRQRETLRYERTRDTEVAAAEADVKIHRVSRELEPQQGVRRDCPHECEEPVDERRTCQEEEREGPVRVRRIDRQRELDLQVYEQHRRQTQEGERDVTTSQRDTREREGDRRRQRDSVRYERTRDTEIAAAEADVKIHRVSRELEPREGVRRDCHHECEEPEDESRTCQDQDTEEPVRVRRINRQRELDLQVYERRRSQTQEGEERVVTTSQRDTQDREGDRRRQQETVRYERTRDTEVAAAEADVKIHRVSRELEPQQGVRRDCHHECEEPEDESRTCQDQDTEEPVRVRRIDRQQELDLQVYERRRRQTQEREERDVTTSQRDTRDREGDRRRQRETLRYERTRDTEVAAAEADVKIHRVSRELEPQQGVRRDCPHECEEPEDERRTCQEEEREGPVQVRRIDRQRELDLQVYERRRRQTQEREERGAITSQRDTQDREGDRRRQRDSVRYERTRDTEVAAAEADVKFHRVSRELEPQQGVRRDCHHECEEPEDERRTCWDQDTEEPVRVRRIDRQRELDLQVYERRRRQTQEREERGAITSQRDTREREGDRRRQQETVRYERTRDTEVAAAEANVKIHRVSRELEPQQGVRRDCPRECEEPEDERRTCQDQDTEEPVRVRRIDRQRELDLQVYERRRHQTQEREERDVTTSQRDTRDREGDRRRQRDSVRYERTRDTEVAAAEADVKIHRVSRELEPQQGVRRDCHHECEEPVDERRTCQDQDTEEPVRVRRIDRQRELDLQVYERRRRQTQEGEERVVTTSQRDTQDREGDRRRQRETVRYERTRDTEVAAAEADVKIHRVSRELEPRQGVQRDCHRECEEPEDERRTCQDQDTEEPVRVRRIDRQRELDLQVYEQRRRQTQEGEHDVTTSQRDTQEREGDRRRQRETVRYERTRDTEVAAAEADVKIHRVSRELEPQQGVRRDCPRECEEPEDERRTCQDQDTEEPVRVRRIDRQRELDLEVYERRRRQTQEREERDVTTSQRDTRDREGDRRRQRETLRYERTRDAEIAAAEADVKIHRVSWELEPRQGVQRDCPRECEEPEDERRTCQDQDTEEPVRVRRIDRQRELDLQVYEQRRHQTQEREERGAITSQRNTRDREGDRGRQRETVRYERTRDTEVAAAEADVKIHRVSRELEPREGVQRDCPRECNEPEDERRTCQEGEREDPVRVRRIDRQRELDLQVYERRRRQTQEREERGAITSQRDTRERSRLQIIEEEQERDTLYHREGSELPCELLDITPCEPSEDQEQFLGEERVCEASRCRAREDERRRQERRLYQTVEVDNRDLCLPGDQPSVTDLRVRYVPAEPDVRPEVQVLPPSCDPQTIAYLVHVIQNGNDPEATTYEIVCHQPHDLGQPVYVKKCYVSPRPPSRPCDGRKRPEPRPQREPEEPEPLRQGEAPAARPRENREDLREPQERSETGVKEGAPATELEGVKGGPCRVKPREERRDNQRPKIPDAGEKEHQPQGDGSKGARERIPQEPESSCQVRECEDREAKSCPPLPQAPEPQEACEPSRQAEEESCPQPPRRDEGSRCREDAELPPADKSCQVRQEENSKRSSRPARDAQTQREEEPRLGIKQRQGPPGPLPSQEAPSRPAGAEGNAS